MLWVMHFEWFSGAQFNFNFLHHWDIMVICDTGGSRKLIHSNEGVTQVNPLEIIVYGLWIMYLISYPKKYHPCIAQPWYNDNA